eukprot:CAMPEP_0184295938 /NCGR_PEP_ID=MMETSP1049-20130417/6878_1 /TAXON_ID=77928 /ORGANISM="Proteomonas sulcata, Strain CCMP704" /LENGTH=326 /DNA_ID=CAMNT_0026604839 /DNA_START=477 /DNA_END=1459 /DNA_ORIENTATION=-
MIERVGSQGSRINRPARSASLPTKIKQSRATPTEKIPKVPSDEEIERLLRYELAHPLAEHGTGKITIKESVFPGGGLGAFASQLPPPIEYKRDRSVGKDGYITQAESDASWARKDEGSTYIMEVTLGADWFRDEVGGNGKLKPMQTMHKYVRKGMMAQKIGLSAKIARHELTHGSTSPASPYAFDFLPVRNNHEYVWQMGLCDVTIVFEDKGERVLYRALLDPENNPSPYLNDALFGKFDGESDEYEVEDECINLFTMIPCLSWSQTQKGKVEFSSVWYYPRNGFPWDKEREVTVGYHWPLEPWMKLADLSLSSNEKAVPERESDQ